MKTIPQITKKKMGAIKHPQSWVVDGIVHDPAMESPKKAEAPAIRRAGADADDVLLAVAEEVRKEGAHHVLPRWEDMAISW